MDPPYILDFLQQVVGVHWAEGNWFAAYFYPGSDNNMDVSLSFPGQAGGTPGITMLASQLAPSGFRIANDPTPYVVKGADLGAKLHTGAGLEVTAFGAKNQLVGVLDGRRYDEVLLLVRMNGFMSKKFRVQINGHANGGIDHFQPYGIYTYKKGVMVAGHKIGYKPPPSGTFTLDPNIIPSDLIDHQEFGWETLVNSYDEWEIDPATGRIVEIAFG